MAEETTTEQPKVETATLAEQIASGIAKSLPEAIRAAQPATREAPARQVLPAIDDPSDEDYVEAVSAGDKSKAADIRRRQRAADRERIRREELSPILTNGGAALASVAKQLAAQNLPHYKRFKKEIDAKIEQFQAANPNVVVTFDHYDWAHKMIVGEHVDEMMKESREEAIRKANEPDPALVPGNERHLNDQPKEPTTLSEALAGDWKAEFGKKAKAVGGRGDDEEMRKAGFRDVKGFLQTRKMLTELETTLDGDSLGLDLEWDAKEKRYLTPDESRRLPI
jgi:hypothetical protein